MPYELASASRPPNAPWTGATWLVSERLSEAGMKITADDGKQKSMTYSSESEDSEHSLAGGVILIHILYCQYTCLLASRGGGLYTTHTCRILFYFILLFYIFYCNL